MGYSSQPGQVILRSQTAQGTYNADTGTAGVGMRLRSGILAPSRELMIPDPEIGGNRDVPDAYLGAGSWGGDYEFYTRPDSLITLLKAALGISASALVTGITTHTFTPADTAQLPYLSVEEKIGAGLETFNYNDVVVNTLHLESDANAYCQGTAGLIGAKQIAGATPTASPVWDTSPLLVGTNITLTYNAVALPAKSFSFDINNNFEDDDYRLGSQYIGDLTPKRREVTAGFTVREGSSALWRQATYGLPALTGPGGLTTKAPLVITLKSFENIPGGTPTGPYVITITMPNFALNPYAFGVSGDDILDDDITGQALRPAVGSPVCTITVATAKAAIS